MDGPSESQYELRDFSDQNIQPEENRTASLPPVDGGSVAWLFLFGSFLIECTLWGFPFSFGVLQDYYFNNEPFASHSQGITAIGPTCSGIMYMIAVPLFAMYQRSPVFCRRSLVYGLVLAVVALIASSFATQIWHLILTQGILYAIGGGLMYYPVFIYIDQWFVRRKGFAYGVMWAGSGCGGLAGPLLINWGLENYGFQTFIRGWAIALLIFNAPFLYFVKPRLPIARNYHVPTAQIIAGFTFVKSRTFWAIQIGNTIQGLGYFIPALYLPAYARSLGLSGTTGSLMVSIVNTASVPGVVFLSALCDRINVISVIFVSALGSAIAIFLLWGFSMDVVTLSVFAVLYGFFAGGFTSTYAGTVQELRRTSTGADLGSIFGLLGLGRGIGNVMCGPLGETLLSSQGLYGKAGFAYGSEYGPLIIFTGITATLTLIPWFAKQARMI